MKLTILGCNGPYPGPDAATSGYLLEQDGQFLLLDCGSGVLSKLLTRVPAIALAGVVISHLHADHMSDLLTLRYALEFAALRKERTEPLPLWLPQTPQSVAQLAGQSPMFAVRPMEAAVLGPFTLDFAAARHPVEAWAIRVAAGGKTLVYTGDTNTAKALEALCLHADCLLADANLPLARWSEQAPHWSAWHAASVAKEAGVSQLILTHFLPEADPEALLEEARACFPAAEAARPGRVFSF